MYCGFGNKEVANTGHVVAPHTITIPGNLGLVFNCTWDNLKFIVLVSCVLEHQCAFVAPFMNM